MKTVGLIQTKKRINQINSAELKTEALCWLRFGKKMDYVCSECSPWNADVIGASKDFVIEVEVKVSTKDLRHEFDNKLTKHAYYNSGVSLWSPNYFYFLIPPEIKDKTIEIVSEKAPKAGVLVYSFARARPGERLMCAKKPTALHTLKPTEKFLKTIWKRMGSELCGLYIANSKLKSNPEKLEELRYEILEEIKKSHGAEDWENLSENSKT